jgi:hypothetical protein
MTDLEDARAVSPRMSLKPFSFPGALADLLRIKPERRKSGNAPARRTEAR